MATCGSYVQLILLGSIFMTIVDGQFTVDLRLTNRYFKTNCTHYRVCENTDLNITCSAIESTQFTSISIYKGQEQLCNSSLNATISCNDTVQSQKRESYTCDLYFSSKSQRKGNLTVKLTTELPLAILKEDKAECSEGYEKNQDETTTSAKSITRTRKDDGNYIQSKNEPAQSSEHQNTLHLVNLILNPQNFRYGLKPLNFVCRSQPPAPMYWAIFGEDGNILDQNNLNASVKVDTNITIHQSVGKTTIEILESSSGGNGIHTVVCVTYGQYLGVATARLNGAERTIAPISLTSSEESDESSTAFPTGTTLTLAGITSEVPPPKSLSPDKSSMAMSMVVTVIPSLITVLIISGIIGVVLYQRRQQSHKDTHDDVIYDVVGLHHETGFTRNPAYQSYDDDGVGPPPCLPPVTFQATSKPCKDPVRDVYSYIDDTEKQKEDESVRELQSNQPPPVS